MDRKLKDLVGSDPLGPHPIAVWKDGARFAVRYVGKTAAFLEHEDGSEYWTHLNEDGFSLEPPRQPSRLLAWRRVSGGDRIGTVCLFERTPENLEFWQRVPHLDEPERGVP